MTITTNEISIHIVRTKIQQKKATQWRHFAPGSLVSIYNLFVTPSCVDIIFQMGSNTFYSCDRKRNIILYM